MGYTREELIASGLRPELVDIMEQALNQGGQTGGGLSLQDILYQLSPIEKQETGEGTTYSLGPSIRNPLNLMGQIIKYSPTSPIYPMAVANKIKEFVSRMKLGPEGLTVMKPKEKTMWPSETRFQKNWRQPNISSPEATTTAPASPVTPEDRSQLGPVGWGLGGQPASDIAPVTTEASVPAPKTSTPMETPPEPEIDMAKLMKSPKGRIDLETELMKIFNTVVPKWEDLPQSEYKNPQTPSEYVSRFLDNALIAASGKDPLVYQQQKKAEAEALADKKRNFAIQRSSQLANMKIQALSDRVRREDEERAQQGKWFEFLDKSTGGAIWKTPSAIAAVASYYGADPAEATDIINKLRNPITGKLEGIGMTELDKQMEIVKKNREITAELYRTAGIAEDQIPFALATGTLDRKTFIKQRMEQAISEGKTTLAERYRTQLATIIQAENINPKKQAALELLAKIQNKEVDLAKAFGSKEAGTAVAQAILGQAMDLDTAVISELVKGIFKDKDMKLKDQIALVAYEATTSPEKMKTFTSRHGMSPYVWINAYMGVKDIVGGALPQPFKIMAESGIDIKRDPLKFIGPGSDSVVKPFGDMLKRKYSGLMDILHNGFPDPVTGQKKEFKEFKSKPLNDNEFYTIITAFENEGQEGFLKAIEQVIKERKK